MTLPEAGSRWQHRKHGLFRVVCVAQPLGQSTRVVVYRSLEPGYESESSTLPLDEFIDGRFSPILEMPMAA